MVVHEMIDFFINHTTSHHYTNIRLCSLSSMIKYDWWYNAGILNGGADHNNSTNHDVNILPLPLLLLLNIYWYVEWWWWW